MSKFHVGRSWRGPGHLEEDCPCEKAPCGLVAERHPDCDAHDLSKTIRVSHRAEDCPGPADWRCECGETRIEERYGGPADHEFDPKAPCEACVMASFAEHG